MTINVENNDFKAIYHFTKGVDKKLRDVMVFSFDLMVKEYRNLSEINYNNINDKQYPEESIHLIIATSIFYKMILKPLYGGRDFTEMMNNKYKLNIKIGKKGQVNIDWDTVKKLEYAFYALTSSYNISPNFFNFNNCVELIKRLTNE